MVITCIASVLDNTQYYYIISENNNEFNSFDAMQIILRNFLSHILQSLTTIYSWKRDHKTHYSLLPCEMQAGLVPYACKSNRITDPSAAPATARYFPSQVKAHFVPPVLWPRNNTPSASAELGGFLKNTNTREYIWMVKKNTEYKNITWTA